MADTLVLPRRPFPSTPSHSYTSNMSESPRTDAIPEEPRAAAPVVHLPPPTSKGEKKNAEADLDKIVQRMKKPLLGIDFTRQGKQRAPSPNPLLKVGISDPRDAHEPDDSSATNLLNGGCCGGGCCRLPSTPGTPVRGSPALPASVNIPENDAFKSLSLKLAPLSSRSRLSGTTPLPLTTISTEPSERTVKHDSTTYVHPPDFLTPHAPYKVFSAKVDHARELTKPGATKRTYHFDLDVTDYPEEAEGVDFRVGGAIGIQAPNNFATVDEVFDCLGMNKTARDETVTLRTGGGRWPTIWGKEEPRSLITTRRELLTWTVDIQSYPPTKNLLRVLAEYATDEDEKTILLYLCSKQGQAAFCELRTGPYITLIQLLNAFPSSKPPFDVLVNQLQTLMPRFYSLSNDPHLSTHHRSRRIVEIAVTVHDAPERWRPGDRTGVGSGFFERKARQVIYENRSDVRIPLFRGLMANPLAREFIADGPMLLIGAGVGVAPFRGFVQRRLQSATCVNKVWVLQGVRDHLLDELYSGEWGVDDAKVRRVIESRRGTGRYVQDEVIEQADLVWFVVNSVDGRVFVCGSSKGMGEGVEEALVHVAMQKGRLSKSEAKEFWKTKKEGGQYIAETW